MQFLLKNFSDVNLKATTRNYFLVAETIKEVMKGEYMLDIKKSFDVNKKNILPGKLGL